MFSPLYSPVVIDYSFGISASLSIVPAGWQVVMVNIVIFVCTFKNGVSNISAAFKSKTD